MSLQTSNKYTVSVYPIAAANGPVHTLKTFGIGAMGLNAQMVSIDTQWHVAQLRDL
jgi:hypothetical protein